MKDPRADSARSALQPGDHLAIACRSADAAKAATSCSGTEPDDCVSCRSPSPRTDWVAGRPARGDWRAGARSILAGGPQILVEAGRDVRHKQLLDVHVAARKLLLVEIAQERVEGRPAALDRIVPDLRPESPARRFRLLDHPGKAHRQRVGVIDRLIGDIARATEGAV